MDRQLLERVLEKLGFSEIPEPSRETLDAIYSAWCGSVPFDNVRKLIHVNRGDTGPLPGATPGDFFESWLKWGTGGTCWSGAGACWALLSEIGFSVDRGVATMLVAPDLPPNHGTVRAKLGEDFFLLDCSILHGKPLSLIDQVNTEAAHPAWGVRCVWKDGKPYLWWRPLHKSDGFECRLERFGAAAAEYEEFYERTRGWSPFNYEIAARRNVGAEVRGIGFGHSVVLRADGSVVSEPITTDERNRVLIEDLGMSEEIVVQIPDDTPTPPPPGKSRSPVAS
jgi:N-hydroxyarylamine O-acetyltransferase